MNCGKGDIDKKEVSMEMMADKQDWKKNTCRADPIQRGTLTEIKSIMKYYLKFHNNILAMEIRKH